MQLSKQLPPPIPTMNLAPMIDVVLLLIIFFMMVSQISEVNRSNLELAKLRGKNEQMPAALTINIDKDGAIIIAGKTLNQTRLLELISAQPGEPSELSVVIRADWRCDSTHVNNTISTLGGHGVKMVRFAVVDAN